MSSRLPSMPISAPDQWAAVKSPVRTEIVVFLRAIGPCSVAELAEATDRPPDGLYHHLRVLDAAGIVGIVAYRRSGRRTEAVYDVRAERLDFLVDTESGHNVNELADLVASLLRRGEREFRAAVQAGALNLSADRRNASIWGDASWLDAERLAAVRHHLAALQALFEEGRRERTGELFALTSLLSPIVRTRTARRPADDTRADAGVAARKNGGS